MGRRLTLRKRHYAGQQNALPKAASLNSHSAQVRSQLCAAFASSIRGLLVVVVVFLCALFVAISVPIIRRTVPSLVIMSTIGCNKKTRRR